MLQNAIHTIPVAPLKIIALDSSKQLGEKINDCIIENRHKLLKEHEIFSFFGYDSNNYLIETVCPRFGSGESKGVLMESVRGKDLFFLVDIVNNSIQYQMSCKKNQKSPDDYFQDLKRLIAACNGKAHRISVIMPFLYEGRQHRRTDRESLDCAIALQELVSMGVDNIITFDAHDARVQNAIPLEGFDNFSTTLQFIRTLLEKEEGVQIDNKNIMIISPDEGGMERAVYYSNILGVDMGMFYKRYDYSVNMNGKHPIVEHQFLGSSVKNKDVFIVDDIITSGENILDIAKELKKREANRVFIASTFGLFTEGLEKFDTAYEIGFIDRIFTTNLVYTTEELLKKPYYINVDLSKYIALIIDTLNYDTSINTILNPALRIQELLQMYKNINKKQHENKLD